MPPRIVVTLLVILGIGVGTGALVFGLCLGESAHQEQRATFIAVGSMILAASLAGLVAHLFGGFRQLDDRDDEN